MSFSLISLADVYRRTEIHHDYLILYHFTWISWHPISFNIISFLVLNELIYTKRDMLIGYVLVYYLIG